MDLLKGLGYAVLTIAVIILLILGGSVFAIIGVMVGYALVGLLVVAVIVIAIKEWVEHVKDP